jgi:hypothetical protein
MSVIEEVRKEREDLARVLKKHLGIRKIVEDLYPDSAHFIFELLQNAEDRNATEARFILSSSKLRFEHNGETFRLQDIYAITDIGEGTKADDDDKIGRFGVGFKSVFAYSETPHIWSPTFSFKISELVLPTELGASTDLNGHTRFDFPFNNPKKAPPDAHKEIETGLNELAETTLLFLRHIESIKWHIEGGSSGDMLRIGHSDHHVEMLKQIDGQTTTNAHFLKFDEPIAGLERQRVAIAFALDYLPNVQAYSSDRPLSKQLKIVPARGQVAVFFPAAKETSGLRFHLHAPFVPELSRASIKETPINKPLFDQLATLSASSLHPIRDLGLLTTDFLGVLPNPQDQLGHRYAGIRDSIIAAMNNEPLTPMYAKRHAPARLLVQAKASLKELLGPEDLEFLIDYDDEPSQWAATATQRNSNAHRLLASLAITEWGINEFVKYLADNMSEGSRYVAQPPYLVNTPDEAATNWLASKPQDWHQTLYALLYSELASTSGLYRLKKCKFVRLFDGNYSTGDQCFFPDDDNQHNEALPRVHIAVYNSGKDQTQQQNARKFLEAIGVRAVGEAEQINLILNQRYTREAKFPDDKAYLKDLGRFIALVEKEPSRATMFRNYFIFWCEGERWCQPAQVYLDQPFLETGLSAFYTAQGDEAKLSPLAKKYQGCGISLKPISAFAKVIGARTTLVATKTNTSEHPQSATLRTYYQRGARWTYTAIDEDWTIEGLEDVLDSKDQQLSLLIWKTMCAAPSEVLEARFRPNQQYPVKATASSLVLALQKASWVHQKNGSFVKPSEASRDLLSDGFSFDPGQKWLKAVKWGEDIAIRSEQNRQKEALARELGFADKGSLERARRFAALPPEDQELILADRERDAAVQLPEHEPNNPDRRAQRVAERAAAAPERRTEVRGRSVAVERDGVKIEADQYLREQYTNTNAEQICQICKDVLPFKLDNGAHFFEAVELMPELCRHHYQNYLCLCPNHSAMFRHTNSSRETLRERILEQVDNELGVILAQQELTIYFTKTHLTDLKSVIAVQQEGDEPIEKMISDG